MVQPSAAGAGVDRPEHAAVVDLDRPVAADAAPGYRAELWRRGAADHAAGADDGPDGVGGWRHQPAIQRTQRRGVKFVGDRAGRALARTGPGSVQLLMSAVLGGLGIGVIQAVMPGIIKHHFLKSMALVAGLWSAALMGGGGLGAAITPWLMSAGHDWHSALAWWALPALVALLAWWPVSRGLSRLSAAGENRGPSLLRNRRAWLLGAYFGLINGGYTSLIAWLPPYYMQLGWQPQASGSLLALMTFGQVVGALLLPALARNHDRRPLLLLALMMQLIGFIGLIYLPQTLPWLWVLLSGLGLGGAFPLCLVLALDHLHQPAAAGRLVAFMQGVGFLLAGVTPYLSGLLRDYSGGFVLDWQIHALLVVVLIVITWRFHPHSYRRAFAE
ncbi:MFS transporter [Serratia marcescens]|nr:MFS transporter [Serratia marcescens]